MSEKTQHYLKIAAVFGVTGVLAGAFGAHALKDMLSLQQLEWWKTAAFYHLVHSLLLVGMALAINSANSKWMLRAFISTAAGIVFFSGSLYLMALFDLRWIGIITPIGGLWLVVGWLCLFMVSKNLLPGFDNKEPNKKKGKLDE